MCEDGEWHCGNEFRTTLFVFSPHKRRAELEAMGHSFERKKCEHGYRLVFDYKLTLKPSEPKYKTIAEFTPQGTVIMKKVLV